MTFFEEYQSRLEQWSDIRGHMEFLHERALKYQTIVELGVRYGNSTSAFLAACEKNRGRLFSVDVERPEVPEWWWNCCFWGFAKDNDISRRIIRDLPMKIEMLLIDTCHTYAHTLTELVLYGTRVTPGGLICCHDALPPPDGVANALRDFCELYGLTWELRPESFGLGIIEIPPS
jgi:predicted O-methyltransferase YrrM